MSRISFLVIFLFTFLSASFAQVEQTDTTFLSEIDSIISEYEKLVKRRKVEEVIQKYNDTQLKREMSFKTDGALHLVRGLLLTWTDHGYIKHDAHFEPKGDAVNWIDYTVGGAPLVVNWMLKSAGVKSRSKTERMLTANAMAMGISFGTTELLKHTIDEGRPDQSDLHSFPSGHTSFAFASATILSREYGYISPWITIAGYTTATGTGLLRIHHNKHWMNDLYMGAGIGVMSTNLAYFLTDKLFGADAINRPELRRQDVERLIKFNEKPSGFTFVSGTEIGDKTIRFADVRVKTGASFSAGADVAWFITPNVAAEFITRVVDAQAKVYDTDNIFTGGHLNLYHFDLGAKMSWPFALGKRLSTRAFAGMRMMNGDLFTDGTTTYIIPNETKFELGAGVTYDCLDTQNYAWGFTCDYYHTFSHYLKNRYSISSSWKILF
jgi:membrane-associated phospholipid phosphatase